MFQIILGISLSVILLFVITLLLTEVAASYPLLNRYDRNIFIRFNDFIFKNAEDRNKARLLLIIMSCILGLCITAFFISNDPETKVASATVVNTESEVSVTPMVTTKTLDYAIEEHSISFTMRTKWSEGKIYSNVSIRFDGRPIWSFKDWTFHLYDADGYLLTKFDFTLSDLVFETKPGGRIAGLSGKTKGDLTFSEFQKIKSMEVILDRKVVTAD